MTTKVEPTVEKWVEQLQSLAPFTYSRVEPFIRKLLAHSVQEAKAEGMLEHGLEALERYFYMVKMPESKVKFWREWYKTCLSLDASLKQEEEA